MIQNLFFIVIAILMCLFAMLLVLPAFFRSQYHHSVHDQNIVAARERLDALNTRIAVGEIDAAAASEYEQEIKSQLLTEAGGWQQISILAGRDKLGIISVVIALVVIAPLLYVTLATPAALNTPTSMVAMIKQLELRVANDPDDLSSLLLLARMLAAHNRISEALAYYKHARKLAGDTPNLLAKQINLLLSHSPDTPEISTLLQKGLDKAPQHPMLLWLAGVHAENQDDHAKALSYWRRSYENLADSSQQRQIVAAAIAEIEQQLDGKNTMSLQ